MTMCPNNEPYEDHAIADECTCTNWCGEGSEAGCCYCVHTDVYEPCPVVGFGCGMNAQPFVWNGVVQEPSAERREPCDCCTPEQWRAASTPSPGWDSELVATP